MAVDGAGRLVVLDGEGWTHITREHPEITDHLAAIMRTVERPDHRGPDPIRGRERYWSRDTEISRWLMVVVDCEQVPARVVTAFAKRKGPPGWSKA